MAQRPLQSGCRSRGPRDPRAERRRNSGPRKALCTGDSAAQRREVRLWKGMDLNREGAAKPKITDLPLFQRGSSPRRELGVCSGGWCLNSAAVSSCRISQSGPEKAVQRNAVIRKWKEGGTCTYGRGRVPKSRGQPSLSENGTLRP